MKLTEDLNWFCLLVACDVRPKLHAKLEAPPNEDGVEDLKCHAEEPGDFRGVAPCFTLIAFHPSFFGLLEQPAKT